MVWSKRKQLIYEAMKRLGGNGTTRQIAAEADMNTNGVSQTLGVMYPVVSHVGYMKGQRTDLWRIETAQAERNLKKS